MNFADQNRRIVFLILSVLLLTAGMVHAVPPPRIASLSPELTEIVFQLGGQNRLVGRSSACDYPAEAKKIPTVGDMSSPALEALLMVKPDLLIAESLYESGARERVEALGVKVELLPSRDLDSYRRAVARLGELLDRKREAGAEIARVDRLIAAVGARHADTPDTARPSVLLVVWDSPLIVAGGGNFLSSLIELAGGRNVAAGMPKPYFRCSAEWALRAAPDLIIYPRGMGTAGSGVPSVLRYQPAVRAGRFCSESDTDLFFRMGPRFTEGLEILEKRIAEAARGLGTPR